MPHSKESIKILVAEDDPDDRLLIAEAFKESRITNEVDFVEDGEQLLDYLKRRGTYASEPANFLPGLLLLDLNMPKKDGREALAEIKADPALRSIPIVILTTSKSEEDIVNTYNLGSNSYIAKPVTFSELVAVVQVMSHYWLDIVELPPAAA